MTTDADDVQAPEEEESESPEECASRWAEELAQARKKLRSFHESGHKAIKRFKGAGQSTEEEEEKRLNLFAANVQQVEAMLFAQVPTVDVERRFQDANDGAARVAAEMLGRILNEDLHHASEDQVLAFKQALSDRLLAGIGTARVRYDAEFETREVEARTDETGNVLAEGYTEEAKTREQAEVLYVHWQDQLWDPIARVFSECRWWAFRVYMGKAELVKRFGEEVGNAVPLNAKEPREDDRTAGTGAKREQAEVWEIWDKEKGEVCWYAEGVPGILDRGEPPMELEGFWPMPRPMFANLTTDDLVPTADYKLAQDLYREVDELVTRRGKLTKALKAVGLYDQSCGDSIGRMLTEANDGELIPVPGWASFAEKGAISGAMVWMPIAEIADAVDKLNAQIQQRKAEIYEVTGWSDIVRGQQAENGTPGEAQVKAHFASARLNAILEEFTRWCSDIQRLRAEVIAKHFDVATILECSNARFLPGPDQMLAGQAAQLLKDSLSCYRIAIKSDAMARADYGALREEATEVLAALGQFMQQAGNVAQAVPEAKPLMLELLRWSMAKLKGGQEIGGMLDRAISAAEQQAQQPQGAPGPQQPDPKVQAAQIQNQGKAQQLQLKAQLDAQHMAMETQQLAQRQRDQVAANVTEELAKAKIKQGQQAVVAAQQGVAP